MTCLVSNARSAVMVAVVMGIGEPVRSIYERHLVRLVTGRTDLLPEMQIGWDPKAAPTCEHIVPL
jgi:hypothetical protein